MLLEEIAKKVTVVVVAYNSGHLLQELIDSVAGLPVVIVDNNSKDGTAELFIDSSPDISYIHNRTNQGYGRAANQAAKMVNTPYFMLANPDLELSLEAIDNLLEATDICEPGWLFIAPDVGEQPEFIGGQSEVLVPIAWASGSAMFFDKEGFENLGGFDENLFLFFEETDLCRRAQEVQMDMYWLPSAKAKHAIGQSVAEALTISWLKDWHYQWSRLYFLRKHSRHIELAVQYVKVLVGYPLRLRMLRQNEGKRHVLSVRLDATRAFISGKRAFVGDIARFT